jgi:hypothetical protein
MKNNWVIYFTWNDGTEDSMNVQNAVVRDRCIVDMLQRKDFKYIAYSRIYVSGEYDYRHVILMEDNQNNLTDY